ncbi:MAG: hypothetical protein NUW01_06735 [Gemmatimonadaceae bacterium]|nr:hypothetical protein [Gemmatimonadaceae bacterium]
MTTNHADLRALLAAAKEARAAFDSHEGDIDHDVVAAVERYRLEAMVAITVQAVAVAAGNCLPDLLDEIDDLKAALEAANEQWAPRAREDR